MKTVKICDLGKMSEHVEDFKNFISDLDNTINVEVYCLKMCGICTTKYFAVIDGIPIIKETYEDLKIAITEKN